MAFYERFEVRRLEKDGKASYRVRYIDTYEIESWETIDKELTKIFTKGGDSFIAKIKAKELRIICMAQNDEYGRLFAFYPN
jgi:hypothetical protein